MAATAPSSTGTTTAAPPNPRVLVATRVHGQEASATAPFDGAKLRAFLRSALGYADAVVVAVEVADVYSPNLLVAIQDVVKEFAGCPIDVLPVMPWGRFVPALNAALSFATQRDFAYILFLSLEMDLTPQAFRALWSNFDPAEDLVVGAGTYVLGRESEGDGATPARYLTFPLPSLSLTRFPSTFHYTALEGHRFQPGLQPLTGTSTPWNTCALWSVAKLGLTGFLAVSDDKSVGGVEEVAVIAVAQQGLLQRAPSGLSSSSSSSLSSLFRKSRRLSGNGMRAKLVHLQGHLAWKVDWTDPARQEWHRKKMESKLARAGAQLEALGLGSAESGAWSAKVWHVEMEPAPVEKTPT